MCLYAFCILYTFRAAALYFDSNDVGDEAFRCLHEMFASDDVEVYHPPFTSKTACLARKLKT